MSKPNYQNVGQNQNSQDNKWNIKTNKPTQPVHNLGKNNQKNEQKEYFNYDQRDINSKNNNFGIQCEKSNVSNPNNNQIFNYNGFTDQNHIIENIIKSTMFKTKIEEYLKYSDILISINSELKKHETEIKGIDEYIYL